jgi:hypothetical protein
VLTRSRTGGGAQEHNKTIIRTARDREPDIEVPDPPKDSSLEEITVTLFCIGGWWPRAQKKMWVEINRQFKPDPPKDSPQERNRTPLSVNESLPNHQNTSSLSLSLMLSGANDNQSIFFIFMLFWNVWRRQRPVAGGGTMRINQFFHAFL